MYTAQFQNTGIFSIGGISRSAEKTCQSCSKAISKQCSVKSGFCQKVFSNCRRDGRHITYVFHHGCNSDRSHNQNGSHIKFCELHRRKTYPVCSSYRRKVQDGRAVRIGNSHRVHNQCNHIRDHNPHQYRDDFEHTFSPDVKDDNYGQSNKCEEPVGGCIVDRRTCKTQSDTDNNRSGYYRRKESHHTFYAYQTNDQSQHQIHQTGYNHTTAGIRSFVIHTHGCIHTGIQVGYC